MKKLIFVLVLCIAMILLTAHGVFLGNLNVVDTLSIDSVNFVTSDGNIKLLDTLTNFHADTLRGFCDFTCNVAQFHRIDSFAVAQADTFINVKWDTLVTSETTSGYSFGADSTYFITSFSGLVRVQGCGHWLWTGADNQNIKFYIRTLVNSIEARCLQSNDTRGKKTSDDGSLDYEGTIFVTAGDTIHIQYRSTSTDLSFDGADVFENPVAFSVNFAKLSKIP